MAKILMPKATAVWLIDNTTLTFEQIAEFCELHPLEVKGIADGEVAENMRGADPVASGELTREEIETGEQDKTYVLQMPPLKHAGEDDFQLRQRSGFIVITAERALA